MIASGLPSSARVSKTNRPGKTFPASISPGRCYLSSIGVERIRPLGFAFFGSLFGSALFRFQVSIDVRAPSAGTLVEQMAADGDTVEVGAPLMKIDASGGGGGGGAGSAPGEWPSLHASGLVRGGGVGTGVCICMYDSRDLGDKFCCCWS